MFIKHINVIDILQILLDFFTNIGKTKKRLDISNNIQVDVLPVI